MSNFPEKKLFEEADNWIKNNKKVSLATVVQTWGSSPLGIGSRMIVSEDGNFLGSVSGGCVEAKVVEECISLMKNKKICKKIDFNVSNENAWEIGLACGGDISIYIEEIK